MTELAANLTPDEVLRSSHELYAEIMHDINQGTPQHQGFTEAEFIAALTDPDVIKTEVTNGEDHCLIPQLSPIDRFEWLNTPFYASRFSEEFTRGDLLHFSDFKGLEPGVEVKERIKDLADREGVLVFDYPSSDPDYPQRVQELVDSLGISSSEIEELGTQTYFAGQVRLKRPHEALDKPLGLNDSFAKLLSNESSVTTGNGEDGPSFQKNIDRAEAEHMNQFYDAAFEVLNDHPCKQGLDPAEFLEMVSRDDEVVKVAYTKDGETAALIILSEDLGKFSWLSPEFFQKNFPEKTATNQLVYFPALASDPEKKGERYTQSMVGLICSALETGDNEILVGFDCCDMNNGFLDKFLEAMINATPEVGIEFHPIGVQRYCAIKTSSI